MRVEIVVPQIGEAVAELTLLSWLKQVGDRVQKGDVLFEIDSDKAIVEVEAFADGILHEIIFPEGSAVLPLQVVAIIETDAEAELPIEVLAPSTGQDTNNTIEKSGNGRRVSPLAQRFSKEHQVDLDEVSGTGPGGRIVVDDVRSHINQNNIAIETPTRTNPIRVINASPKARRLARERQIDLSMLQGSGIEGMIRVKDLGQLTDVVLSSTQHTSKLSKLRHTVALRTQSSKQEVPHFYLMVDVDMSECNRLRAYCREQLNWEKAPTYTAILLRACSLGLVALPHANCSYHDGTLIQKKTINLGIATSTEKGLVVPVIADTDKQSLLDISENLRGIASRARDGRLRQADLGDKSMVISNLGMYAVDQFIAIIDMPDPMILAVGRVSDRVVPVDGQVTIKPMCTLSLSVDHRVMDGVQGAQFLEHLKNSLENPFEILKQ